MRRGWRLLMAAGLLAGLVPLFSVGVTVADNAVVAAPCLDGDFDTALATALTNGGGTITFACGGPTTITFLGQKTITAGNNVVIDGANQITLDGDEDTRLFVVEAGATLELRNLTLINGEVTGGGNHGGAVHNLGTLIVDGSTFDDNYSGRSGGAIFNEEGTLTISNSAFYDNFALVNGGAIRNDGVMTVNGTTFDENATAASGVLRVGGAISINGLGGSAGPDTITNSTFTNNFADDNGGAIFMTANTDLTITGSTFSMNEAETNDGGAIRSNGTLTVESSTFTDNISGRSGGGIDTDLLSTTTIRDSTFDGNQANGLNGGGVENDGMLTVERSTFSNNTANHQGGGLANLRTATIDTSTFSGNEATGANGGNGDGGGVRVLLGNVTISNTTITNNTALAVGGGIDKDPASILNLSNTIVADNTAGVAGTDDCENNSNTITSLGYNLDSDNSCDLDEPTDIPAGNADLGPLANNGGTTLTHMPSGASDAIDNGPFSCTSPDQRGQARPYGPVCDIGAVERRDSATYPLCVVWNTGRVVSPRSGQCGAGQYELNVPDIYPTTFCVDRATGQLYWFFTQQCNYPKYPVAMPANGDLLTCVDTRTTMNRRVFDHSQCFTWELPNTIPATP